MLCRKACSDWLAKHRGNFGSTDGLPGELYRKAIYNWLTPQVPVAIVTPHGQVVTGKIVMEGPAGWVACDDRTGGAHPLICGPDNTVWTPGLHFKKAPGSVTANMLCKRGVG